MKKVCISFALLTIIILIIAGFGFQGTAPEYLRIHIRANSNAEVDQAVKYRVKTAVVDYLTPYIAECDTKEKAIGVIGTLLGGIEDTAEAVLRANGFSYGAHADVRREEFPTRVYGDFTLEAGIYDALILELGSGEGDNWWCVVYPPLCFVGEGSGNYIYKSKLLEIIERFGNR